MEARAPQERDAALEREGVREVRRGREPAREIGRGGGIEPVSAGAIVERRAAHRREVVEERPERALHAEPDVERPRKEGQRSERALHEGELALARSDLVSERDLGDARRHLEVRRRVAIVAPDRGAHGRAPQPEERAVRRRAVELDLDAEVLPLAFEPEAAAPDREAIEVRDRAADEELVLAEVAPVILRLDVAAEAERRLVGLRRLVGRRRGRLLGALRLDALEPRRERGDLLAERDDLRARRRFDRLRRRLDLDLDVVFVFDLDLDVLRERDAREERDPERHGAHGSGGTVPSSRRSGSRVRLANGSQVESVHAFKCSRLVNGSHA